MGETRSDNDPTAVLPRRIAAYIIDSIFVAGFALAMAFLFIDSQAQVSPSDCDGYPGVCRIRDGEVFFADNGNAIAVVALPLLLWFLMHVVLQGLTGATPGKALMGLRTVNSEDYSIAGIGKTLIRSVLFIVDGIFGGIVGLATAIFTKGHRRIGDMVAGTAVVASQSLGHKAASAVTASAPTADQTQTPAWGAAALASDPTASVPETPTAAAWDEAQVDDVATAPTPAWGETPPPPAWGTTDPPDVPATPATQDLLPQANVEAPATAFGSAAPENAEHELSQNLEPGAEQPVSPWEITPPEPEQPGQAFDPFSPPEVAAATFAEQVDPSQTAPVTSGDAFIQPLASENPFDPPEPEPEPSMFDNLEVGDAPQAEPVDMSVDPFDDSVAAAPISIPPIPTPPVSPPAAETILVPPPQAPSSIASEVPEVLADDAMPMPEPVEAAVPSPFDAQLPADPIIPETEGPVPSPFETPADPPQVDPTPIPEPVEAVVGFDPFSIPDKPAAPEGLFEPAPDIQVEPASPAAEPPEVPADVASAVSQAASEAIAAPAVSPSGLFRVAAEPELVHGDIPTTRQPATETPAAPPEPSGPQWDTARDTYVQWDPVLDAWMQWDSASDRWIPLST
ncbi:MAG: RDD family protein [Acidimicrobiales bacterium]